MLRRTNIVLVIVEIAGLVATWAMLGTAVAQKAAAPKPQDKPALGEDEVKQLLLHMDTDKNGKITKQGWMKFMKRSSPDWIRARTGSWTSRNSRNRNCV